LGVVKTFDIHTENILFKKQLEKGDKSQIKSLIPIGDDIMNQKLLFAETNGDISLIQLDIDNIEEQKQEKILTIKKRADDRKLLAMEHRANSQYLFLGQFVPQIHDIETLKWVWKGRNVENDQDDLEVATYDTSGEFMTGSKRVFVTSNGHGKIRLYDVNAQARPVKDIQASDMLLSKIKSTECGNYVIYASQKGELTKADIRMDFRTVHRFKGSSGSIRDISVCSDFIAWVGLDRHLRVYDHVTCESMTNIYLKQKLCSVLIDPTSAKEYTSSVHEYRKELDDKEEQDHVDYWEQTDRKYKKRGRSMKTEMVEKDKKFKTQE
jgi:WD40 repeat protein